MKRFELHRDTDEGGVSGTGVVAEGVQFKKGKVVISWLTEVSSCAFYDSIADVEKIHGHAGKTRIVWCDPPAPSEHRGGYRDAAPPPPMGGTNSPKASITIPKRAWDVFVSSTGAGTEVIALLVTHAGWRPVPS